METYCEFCRGLLYIDSDNIKRCRQCAKQATNQELPQESLSKSSVVREPLPFFLGKKLIPNVTEINALVARFKHKNKEADDIKVYQEVAIKQTQRVFSILGKYLDQEANWIRTDPKKLSDSEAAATILAYYANKMRNESIMEK